MNNSVQRDTHKTPQLEIWLRPKSHYGCSALPTCSVLYIGQHFITVGKKAMSTE